MSREMTIVADLLETIVSAARRTVAIREQRTPLARLRERLDRRPRGRAFEETLRASAQPRVIAECKRRSPSKGILRLDYDPVAHARAYAAAGAAAISVLTESTFFDGSLEHLAEVRAAVDLPLLRKDFIVCEYQLVEAAVVGADAVLLIAGALSGDALARLIEQAAALDLAPLVEVHDLIELERAAAAGATIVGVNSRNLRTLAVDLTVLEHVIAAVPTGTTTVAESGIRTPADIERLTTLGYHACLVGERLMMQPDPGAALKALRAREAGR
jgi:indole-3-glycerol phosphate synthase